MSFERNVELDKVDYSRRDGLVFAKNRDSVSYSFLIEEKNIWDINPSIILLNELKKPDDFFHVKYAIDSLKGADEVYYIFFDHFPDSISVNFKSKDGLFKRRMVLRPHPH